MNDDASEIIAQLTALTSEETSSMVGEVVEALEDELEEAVDLLVLLRVYTQADITPALIKLVELGEFFPPSVFRGAGPAVSALLLEAIAEGSSDQHRALQALAWVCDESAAVAFSSWRKAPPEGFAELEDLGYTLNSITHEAGWEVGPDDQPVLLSSQHCVGLVKLDDEQAGPGIVQLPHSTSCPWCSRPLTTLFRLQRIDLGLAQAHDLPDNIDVLTCTSCVASEADAFGRIGLDGSATWHPASQFEGGLSEEDTEEADAGLIPTCRLGLGDTRPPWHSIQVGLPTPLSQVGGLPTWIQDAHYPSCPGCEVTMKFIAQVDQGSLAPNAEGVFYGFFCAPCRVTATRFQMG